MGSIENAAPFRLLPAIYLWTLAVKGTRLPKLQFLGLREWEMVERDTAEFMYAHKDTLMDICLENCMVVVGDWSAVLAVFARYQERLFPELFQISEDFVRIEFPTTCTSYASPTGDEDWTWVKKIGTERRFILTTTGRKASFTSVGTWCCASRKSVPEPQTRPTGSDEVSRYEKRPRTHERNEV
jgi:hypothetical protein